MVKHWIPFRFMPASWGLEGNAYSIAEAHYSLSGEALERRLAEIVLIGDDLRRELLEIDHKYGHLSSYDAARQRVELTQPPGVERDLMLLAADHDHGKLSDIEYGKQCAALKNEPWISIINAGFDPQQGINGVFFEFDWNAQWIEFLRANGYVGHNDEQVVDEWFADVCRSQGQANEPLVPFTIGGL